MIERMYLILIGKPQRLKHLSKVSRKSYLEPKVILELKTDMKYPQNGIFMTQKVGMRAREWGKASHKPDGWLRWWDGDSNSIQGL